MELLSTVADVVFDIVHIAFLFSYFFVPVGIIMYRWVPWSWQASLLFVISTISAPVFLLCWMRAGFNKTYTAFGHITSLITRTKKTHEPE